MILLPAMDLYEQKVVRLTKGDYAQMKVYSENPLRTADRIAASGAAWLHAVDLEGARDGGTPNLSVIKDICKNTSLSVEIGGGIRSAETIEAYLDAGVKRVILGTKAIMDPRFLEEAVQSYGDAVAVGADLLDGKLAVHGWQETAETDASDFFAGLCSLKVKTVICTDISKDGMLSGTNLPLYRDLSARFPIDIIASGGVSSLEEIRRLREMGLYGAILGKAMYENKVALSEALSTAEQGDA